MAKAFCSIERGDPEQSLEILSTDGLDLTASEIWPLALAVRGVAEIFVRPGRVDTEDIEQAISGWNPRRTSGYFRSVLMAVLSAIHLSVGDAGKAAAVLEGLAHRPHVQLGKARLALAEGDFAKAEKALVSIGTVWPKSERAKYQELFMFAAVAGQAGRDAEAKDLFDRAMHLRRSGLGVLMSTLPDPALEHLPGDSAVNARMFRIPALPAPVRLTVRECIVLKTLAVAESAAAAALELGVSLNTVKAQSRSIYRKLNVSTLRDALAEARSLRLI